MRTESLLHTLLHTLADGPGRALATLRLWAEVRRRRRAMAETCPRLLEDMGIDPLALEAEVARPFWDVSEAERAAIEAARPTLTAARPARRIGRGAGRRAELSR